MTYRFTLSATALALVFGAHSALADAAIELTDPTFAPEGIGIARDGTIYTGSLTQGALIAIDPKTRTITPFAESGANGMVTTVGVHVTSDDSRVMACSSDPGFAVHTGAAAPALVAFDRLSGAAAGRFEIPGGGFCNDIAELADGTILVTDSFAPRIYALVPGADHLSVWLEDDRFISEGIALNGIAVEGDAVYFVQYNAGDMFKAEVNADGSSGAITRIDLPRQLDFPDGLLALGDHAFLVVEGGGLNKGARGALSIVRLDGMQGALTTLSEDMNIPTTAAIHGDTLYVVEGQLDHLFDPEAGAPDTYRILELPLP
ncbi:hypothetical protein [Actibacterium sp.]|uniref:hypothetical protein n=1 Tax=Actibacterium sp. TaxID=1872125 RepID=UPI0035616BBC